MSADKEFRQKTECHSARLLWPRPSLSGCIAIGVVRDTRGRELADAERYNHFPASPYCAISWCFEGEASLVTGAAGPGKPAEKTPFPKLAISGPSKSPIISWNPGSFFGLTVGFYPDAWQRLTGLKPEKFLDRHEKAEDCLASPLHEQLQEIFGAATAELGFTLLEDLFEPVWRARRPEPAFAPLWLKDWTLALAARAATSGPGKSARQFQRRIRTWTGQSRRDLARVARIEYLFGRGVSGNAEKRSDLAGLAQEFGYADQAHMGREVRGVTGSSPAKIKELIEREESYWLYRLVGEHLSSGK